MSPVDSGRPGSPSEPAPAPPNLDPHGPYRLRRSSSDRVIAGVCGGLGAALGVDPVWLRLAAVVLAFGSGTGVLLYVAAWVLMPEENAGSPIERHPDVPVARGSVIAGLALIGVGTVLLLNRLVPWFDQVLWPLAVVAAGLGLVYAGSRR